LAPPTYLAAPEVPGYHAIALCEHVAGGDIGVFGTHIRARVIHADVGPFPIFPIQMVISAGAGRPAASWKRVVRSLSRYLRFFFAIFLHSTKRIFLDLGVPYH
jgi:hypothetical protein